MDPKLALSPGGVLRGRLRVPGDKSISHRALLLGAIADGVSEVWGLLDSADVAATRDCLSALGIAIDSGRDGVRVLGRGLYGLTSPRAVLDCRNSGTTMRLLLGILAGQPFSATLDGDASLRARPMRRVAAPLMEMGARIELTADERAPLRVIGRTPLSPIRYHLPVASAQLKSALLLGGLYASKTTQLFGAIDSRDHTERMLPAFGVALGRTTAGAITIEGGQRLRATRIVVPGDPSAAAFFIVAASLIAGSDIVLPQVAQNPTRDGLVQVLRRMGADISVENLREASEPFADLRVRARPLCATSVEPHEIPTLIDELPILAIAAACASGRTEVRGASELRVKESDRLAGLVRGLSRLGVFVEERLDGFVIEGPQRLRGAAIDAAGDHRLAMAFAIAGLVAEGTTTLHGAHCVAVSYPDFFADLASLRQSL